MRATVARFLPSSLGGLAALACVLCCLIPALAVAGILGGAAWAIVGNLLPGIAILLAGAAALTWRWSRRRLATSSAGR